MSSLDLYSLFVSTLPVTWNLKGNHVDMYYISGNLLRYLSIWVFWVSGCVSVCGCGCESGWESGIPGRESVCEVVCG